MSDEQLFRVAIPTPAGQPQLWRSSLKEEEALNFAREVFHRTGAIAAMEREKESPIGWQTVYRISPSTDKLPIVKSWFAPDNNDPIYVWVNMDLSSSRIGLHSFGQSPNTPHWSLTLVEAVQPWEKQTRFEVVEFERVIDPQFDGHYFSHYKGKALDMAKKRWQDRGYTLIHVKSERCWIAERETVVKPAGKDFIDA